MLGPGPSRGGQPFSLPKMEDVVSGAWKDPSYPESVDLEAVASPEDADYPSLKAMNDEGHKLTAQQYQNFKTATKALKFSAYAMLTAEEAMQRGFRRPMHAELLPLLHLVQDGWTD